MANTMAKDPVLTPTAAARQACRSGWKCRGASEEAVIERLVKKWRTAGASELASARKRVATAANARAPSHRSMAGPRAVDPARSADARGGTRSIPCDRGRREIWRASCRLARGTAGGCRRQQPARRAPETKHRAQLALQARGRGDPDHDRHRHRRNDSAEAHAADRADRGARSSVAMAATGHLRALWHLTTMSRADVASAGIEMFARCRRGSDDGRP